jgi:hypothetical protein
MDDIAIPGTPLQSVATPGITTALTIIVPTLNERENIELRGRRGCQRRSCFLCFHLTLYMVAGRRGRSGRRLCLELCDVLRFHLASRLRTAILADGGGRRPASRVQYIRGIGGAETPGTLWSHGWIDARRISVASSSPDSWLRSTPPGCRARKPTNPVSFVVGKDHAAAT